MFRGTSDWPRLRQAAIVHAMSHPRTSTCSHNSFWATFGGVRDRAERVPLKELNRLDEARDALSRTIALANSVAKAKLIRRELDGLE
jgi:hypothetical protein